MSSLALSSRRSFLRLGGGWLAFTCARAAHAGPVEDQIQAVETRRLAALAAGDAATLRDLLSEDYVHVHGTGEVNDRETFINGVLARPRRSTRGVLTTRIYKDVAVVVGEQTNLGAGPGGEDVARRYIATQVAHRERGGWRFVSMQVTPLGARPPPNSSRDLPPLAARQPSRAQQEVADLEARRAAAIAARDFDSLAAVLAPDYLHVLGNGTTTDRAGYVDLVRAGPRVPTRGPLKVRIYGDVAVLTGELLNRVREPGEPERILDTYVTQVARHTGEGWRFVSFQITMRAPPG